MIVYDPFVSDAAPEPPESSEPPEPAGPDSDQAYFQAIEELFVRLRGAPLLLSPADWQVAARWHREGIPLALVLRVVEEVFARRAARGAKGRIQSLRYCKEPAEAAWAEIQSLTGPGRCLETEPLDLPPRLAALAARLPAEDLEAAHDCLRRQLLRRRLRAPVLSLFSPEAVPAGS